MRYIPWLLLLAVWSCNYYIPKEHYGPVQVVEHPTFNAHIKPMILDPICARCHGSNSNLPLVEYADVLDYVVKRDSSRSIIYQDVLSKRMPLGGPALDPALVGMIQTWVDEDCPQK